jgi:hypothetical protein
MVPLHGLPFHLGFKIMNLAFICHKNISPWASKHFHNLEEMAVMAFNFVLECEIPRNPFCAYSEYSSSWMMASVLPLLTDRKNASSWVVMLQSSWIIVLAHSIIARPTGVICQPEWGTHGAALSYFAIPHSFYWAMYGAAVDCSICINIAKQFMDIPDCYFLCNKELFSQHIVCNDYHC